MTIQAGSTTREILKELEYLQKEATKDSEPKIVCTQAIVAAIGNLEYRLEEISCYLASIEGQLFVRK